MQQNERPDIKIYYSPGTSQKDLSNLFSGIEEEGIPWMVSEVTNPELVQEGVAAMAFAAAEESRLSVGVALGPDGVALHYSKLDPGQPLFYEVKEKINGDLLRKIGSDAARLVKGIPFKQRT